jgi:hypothetical protein
MARNNGNDNSPRAPSSSGGDNKRFSLNVSSEIAELVEYLASSQSITANEAIRRAIVTESFLLQEREAGCKVLIQSDIETRQILFR